jgi:hypothetical protein
MSEASRKPDLHFTMRLGITLPRTLVIDHDAVEVADINFQSPAHVRRPVHVKDPG